MKKYYLLAGMAAIVAGILISSGSTTQKNPQVNQTLKAAEITDPSSAPAMPAVADGNRLQPDRFRVAHLRTLPLMITALDRDYPIRIPELGVNQTVLRGTSAVVNIKGLGEGVYLLQCGEGCTATVEVLNAADTDQ